MWKFQHQPMNVRVDFDYFQMNFENARFHLTCRRKEAMVNKSHILSVCVQTAGVFRLKVLKDFASFLFFFFFFPLPFYLDCVEKQVKGISVPLQCQECRSRNLLVPVIFPSYKKTLQNYLSATDNDHGHVNVTFFSSLSLRFFCCVPSMMDKITSLFFPVSFLSLKIGSKIFLPNNFFILIHSMSILFECLIFYLSILLDFLLWHIMFCFPSLKKRTHR